MTVGRLGWASTMAAGLGLIGALVIATYVPPAHPIHAAGARAVDVRSGGSFLPYRGRVPAASMSLQGLRCAVWTELTRQDCGDATALNHHLWPWLAQSPATLYWPLPSVYGISPVSGPSGFNVEYQPALQRLVVHQYVSQPLFVSHPVDSTVGAAPAPGLDLLVINTAPLSSGVTSLQEDFWIERLGGDQANGSDALGTVAIT